MHATRTNRYVTCFTTLALLAATASCADDSEDVADAGAPAVAPATSTPAASTTLPASSGARGTPAAAPTDTIPDGRYERVITPADAERLGVDPAVAAEAFGDELHVAIEVEGDQWRQLQGANPDRLEVGDEGTSVYDDEGTGSPHPSPPAAPAAPRRSAGRSTATRSCCPLLPTSMIRSR